MNDPCKSCGAIKCGAYEACQCCGKCRNCGQDFGKHVPSPYVVQPFVISHPVPWAQPNWPVIDITFAAQQPSFGECFSMMLDGSSPH